MIGNKSYELALHLDGRLGFCKSRANISRPGVNVTLNAANYRSQLGVVEVSSLSKRMICYPTLESAFASTWICARKTEWSQTAYAEAVRYAHDLGMDFTTVVLDVKVGSSLWLFAPMISDDLFSLRCPLPEDNYTVTGAVVQMLFHKAAANNAVSEIFNLASIPDADYGSFIPGPREGFNLSAYYAISNEGSDEVSKSAV